MRPDATVSSDSSDHIRIGGKADERGALHGGHGALRGTQVKYCGAADIGDFRRRSAGSMTSPASTEATT